MPDPDGSRDNGFEGAAMIESSSLFKGLPGDIIDKIAKLRVRRRLEPDAVLFRKGDPGDALYGVMAGRLRIHANASDGRDALLNIMGPGDIFGEIALIDGLPRTADATAIDRVELMVLPRAEFLDLLRRENELGLHLLQLTCRRLRWLADMVEDATFLSAPAGWPSGCSTSPSRMARQARPASASICDCRSALSASSQGCRARPPTSICATGRASAGSR